MTGSSGMLGSALVHLGQERGNELHTPASSELDITDPESVAQVAAGRYPADWCINCAAYTAVDRAEEEPDEAYAVNALGPGLLARACATAGIRLLHISTDFVFDGTKGEPYVEEDRPNPLGVYGRSKLEGELAVLEAGFEPVVVRTSWLFGSRGNSFPRTILRAWLEGRALRVVDDQLGTPTYAPDLAQMLLSLVQLNVGTGTYHAAGSEAVSWHQLAVRACAAYQRAIPDAPEKARVEPISSDKWPTPARRPTYSALSCEKLSQLGIASRFQLDDALEDFAGRIAGRL